MLCRDRNQSGGQNLGNSVPTGRQAEGPGNPERNPARTQQRIVVCWKTSPKYDKARYEVALRGNHVACLLIMFCQGRLAMPSSRYENVKARHSSFLRQGYQCKQQQAWEETMDEQKFY